MKPKVTSEDVFQMKVLLNTIFWIFQIMVCTLYIYSFWMLIFYDHSREATGRSIVMAGMVSSLLCTLSLLNMLLMIFHKHIRPQVLRGPMIAFSIWIFVHSWMVFWYNALLYGGGLALLR